MRPVFRPLGDRALTVEFGQTIDTAVNKAVISLGNRLEAAAPDWLIEVVPTYRSLVIVFDPLMIGGTDVEAFVANQRADSSQDAGKQHRWRVPVHYGGDGALDLEALADEKGMSVDDLIALHSGAEYRVFMIGFAPGFTYLGGLPAELHTPRLATPRQFVPAGAIGIGGQQASINSVAGPSGWRFIGETPIKAFDPQRSSPFLFEPGDVIRFVPVGADEAAQLAALPQPITPEVAE